MGAQQSFATGCDIKAERKSPKRDSRAGTEIVGKSGKPRTSTELAAEKNVSGIPLTMSFSTGISATIRSEAEFHGDFKASSVDGHKSMQKRELSSRSHASGVEEGTRELGVSAVNSYVKDLSRFDKMHFKDKETKVFWFLGRFLANEQIASTIIRKYNNMGRGIDCPQKILSFLLRLSFENLSNEVVNFLLSEEHCASKGLWVPYKICSVKSFILDSDEFSKAVRTAAPVIRHEGLEGEVRPMNVNGKRVSADGQPAKIVDVKLSRPQSLEIIDFEKLLEPEVSIKERGAQTEDLKILCANSCRGDSTTWSLTGLDEVMPAGKKLEGRILTVTGCSAENELSFGMEPLHQPRNQALDRRLIDNSMFIMNKRDEDCSSTEVLCSWPYNANCHDMLHRVRCLVQINSTLKSGIDRSCVRHAEGKTLKGKRVRRGKIRSAEPEAGLPQEEMLRECTEDPQRHSCEHPGCLTLQEELGKDNVFGVCKIRTIFPFFVKESNAMNFLRVEGRAREIPGILSDVIQCDCSMNKKLLKGDKSSFAALTFSSGQRHFHDDLVIDLILPKHDIDESWNSVLTDAVRLLRLISSYVCEVRKQSMAIGIRIPEKMFADHLRGVQSLCQNIFCFIVFSEVCGPAEQSMAGGFYLTAARKHYEKSFDSAIAAGILPTFVKLLNDHVVEFPRTMRIVKQPSVYSAVLGFLDVRLPEEAPLSMDTAKTTSKDLRVEAAAVSILETILGRGFQHSIDDEDAFKALTGQVDQRARGDEIAVVTPIFDPVYAQDVRLHLYGFSDLASCRNRVKVRIQREKEFAALRDDLSMTFTKEMRSKQLKTIEDMKQMIENKTESDAKSLSEQLHEFFDSLQEYDPHNFSVSLEDAKKDLESGDGERSAGAAALENTTTNARVSKHSILCESPKDTKTVTCSEEVEGGEENRGTTSVTCKSKGEGTTNVLPAEGCDYNKTRRKKPNRDYLSPARRQQRQAQRLREKWERKHQSSDNSSKQGSK